MNMMGQQGQLDGEFFDEGMQEVAALIEEAVVIKRFLNAAGGNPARGIGDTISYTDINTTALIESLSAQEINFPNSIYAAGDLRAQFKFQVFGADASNGDATEGSRRSDLVQFRDRTYRIIGHVDRIHYGGIYYWSAILRQNRA